MLEDCESMTTLLVSFAAVIRVVTQEKGCVTTLITPAKETMVSKEASLVLSRDHGAMLCPFTPSEACALYFMIFTPVTHGKVQSRFAPSLAISYTGPAFNF